MYSEYIMPLRSATACYGSYETKAAGARIETGEETQGAAVCSRRLDSDLTLVNSDYVALDDTSCPTYRNPARSSKTCSLGITRILTLTRSPSHEPSVLTINPNCPIPRGGGAGEVNDKCTRKGGRCASAVCGYLAGINERLVGIGPPMVTRMGAYREAPPSRAWRLSRRSQ